MAQAIVSDFQKDGYVSKSEGPKYRELLLQNGISPGDILDSGGRIRHDISPEVIDDLYALRDDLYSKVGDPLFPDIEYDIKILDALMTDIGLNDSKSQGIKKLQQALGTGLNADPVKLLESLNKRIQSNPRQFIEWLSKGNNRQIFIDALKPYLSNPKYEKQVAALLISLLTLPDPKGKLMDLAARLFSSVSRTNKAQSGRILHFIENPAAIVLLAALSNIGGQDLLARLGATARPDEIKAFNRVAKEVQKFGAYLASINFGTLCGKEKIEHFIAVCKIQAQYNAGNINEDQYDEEMANLHFVLYEGPEYLWIHNDGSSVSNNIENKSSDYGELLNIMKEKTIESLMDMLSEDSSDPAIMGKTSIISEKHQLQIEETTIGKILGEDPSQESTDEVQEESLDEEQDEIPNEPQKEIPEINIYKEFKFIKKSLEE